MQLVKEKYFDFNMLHALEKIHEEIGVKIRRETFCSLRKIVEKKGIFQILYVDRAGVYGGPKRSIFSQVERALSELGVQIIYAQSPEGKGRIEGFSIRFKTGPSQR